MPSRGPITATITACSVQPLRTQRGKGIAPGNATGCSSPCATTIEQRIFCQSIPNANNSLNKICPRTGCLHHSKRLPRPRPAPLRGGTRPATSFVEARTKSYFYFLQRNSGTGGRVADSPEVAAPPGMPAQISDPLRNIQVDTHALSKITKKLAIRRLAAHFPVGSELD